MNDGSGVADLPEIDNRTGAQMDDTGFHPAMESFAYRARLDRTNGQHDTQVLWLSRTGRRRSRTQFDVMRQWLDNLAADTCGDPQSVKVRRAKPADLRDGCFMAGRRDRRPDVQRHLAALRQPRGRSPAGRCRAT